MLCIDGCLALSLLKWQTDLQLHLFLLHGSMIFLTYALNQLFTILLQRLPITFKTKNNKTKELSTKLLPTGILQQLPFEFGAELNPEFNHKNKHLCYVASCSVSHWGKFAQVHTSEMLTLLPPCKQLSILGRVCSFLNQQGKKCEENVAWHPHGLSYETRSWVKKNWNAAINK